MGAPRTLCTLIPCPRRPPLQVGEEPLNLREYQAVRAVTPHRGPTPAGQGYYRPESAAATPAHAPVYAGAPPAPVHRHEMPGASRPPSGRPLAQVSREPFQAAPSFAPVWPACVGTWPIRVFFHTCSLQLTLMHYHHITIAFLLVPFWLLIIANSS